MTSKLLGRSLGTISPEVIQQAETSRLLHALQAAPGIRFDGSDGPTSAKRGGRNGDGEEGEKEESVWAHKAGVNCLTIDRYEGR